MSITSTGIAGVDIFGKSLKFPEGPVACADGSVLVVEMFGERITRIKPDGSTVVVAEVPGGPNGLAECADGSLVVCNNGGSFTPIDLGTLILPGPFDPARHTGGRIERVDAKTGKITRLYDSCDGHPLRGPNDLVLDGNGGFYFTDHGIRHERSGDRTSIYYAKLDGSMIKEVVFPVEAPNGIGLSPDGTKLYYAETHTARTDHRVELRPAFRRLEQLLFDMAETGGGLLDLQFRHARQELVQRRVEEAHRDGEARHLAEDCREVFLLHLA